MYVVAGQVGKDVVLKLPAIFFLLELGFQRELVLHSSHSEHHEKSWTPLSEHHDFTNHPAILNLAFKVGTPL